jgi:hypothetical protein
MLTFRNSTALNGIGVTLGLAVYRQLVRLGAKRMECYEQIFFSTEH